MSERLRYAIAITLQLLAILISAAGAVVVGQLFLAGVRWVGW